MRVHGKNINFILTKYRFIVVDYKSTADAQRYIRTCHVLERAREDIDKSKDTSQVRKTVARRGEAISRRANGLWLKLAFPAGFFRVLQARPTNASFFSTIRN